LAAYTPVALFRIDAIKKPSFQLLHASNVFYRKNRAMELTLRIEKKRAIQDNDLIGLVSLAVPSRRRNFCSSRGVVEPISRFFSILLFTIFR